MSESRATRVAHWLIAVALAVPFTAFQIQSSRHSGALSLPVTYDDVGYFNDALARLEVLYRDGGWAFLKGLWSNPPHAPSQTLLALVGFGLLGPRRWAPDLMNAVPLALFVRILLHYATRTLALSTATLVAAAFLGFPLLGLLILECRPDMLCALLTAAGALIVVADPRWREGDRIALATAVALFVGALLTKPTLAPVTAVVFGVAAIAAVGLQSKSRDDVKRIARLAIICGGVSVVVVLPYYAAVIQRLYEYITVNAFGSQASIWAKNSATPNPAVYYLTGPGGKAALGTPWLSLGGVLAVAAAPVWLLHLRVALSVCLVALVAYAAVTVPDFKSPFIGVIVSALLLGIMAIFSVAILSRLPRQAALAGALALVFFSAATWRPVMPIWYAFVPATQSKTFTRIYFQTVDALASIPDLDRRRLYFPVIAQYLNPDNVEFELRRRGMPVPASVPLLYFDADIASHEKEIAQAGLVVLFSDDSTLPLPWPASVTIRKEINAAVAKSGAFETITAVDGGPYLGQVFVLKRKAAPQ
jgi:hypothetical protein